MLLLQQPPWPQQQQQPWQWLRWWHSLLHQHHPGNFDPAATEAMARSAGAEPIPVVEPIAPAALAPASINIAATSASMAAAAVLARAEIAAAAVLARAEIAEPESSSLPLPVLPVLRGHLSDVSITTTEMDFGSLPELAENDNRHDGAGDGFDLLLDHDVNGLMNGDFGGYHDLRDLTRHRSRSPPGRWVLLDPSAGENQFLAPRPPSRRIVRDSVGPPHTLSVGAMFRSVLVRCSADN